LCAPCWRNESIRCKWNKTFSSNCLIDLKTNDVLKAIEKLTTIN